MKNKFLTYSFLEYINENDKSNNLINIFIPLFKKILYDLNRENINAGDFETLKEKAASIYGIGKIPDAILKKIMKVISQEVNKIEQCLIYNENSASFQIIKPTFLDYEDDFKKNLEEYNKLENFYNQFKKDKDKKETFQDFLEFLELNKNQITAYFTNEKIEKIKIDGACFYDFISEVKGNIEINKVLKRVFIGSIITNFLEVDKDALDNKNGVNLVVDTTFVLGFLDYKSSENNNICRDVFKLGKKAGYNFLITDVTINEVKSVLSGLLEKMEGNNYFEALDSETPISACLRRKLTKNDIQREISLLESTLKAEYFQIIIIDKEMKEKALESGLYKVLIGRNNKSRTSIEHDAILNLYVKEKRDKNLKNFYNIRFWVLMNIKTDEVSVIKRSSGNYYENITVDTLLSILWLSNPVLEPLAIEHKFEQFMNFQMFDKKTNSFLKTINENIKKYNSKGKITNEEIASLALAVAERGIYNEKNIEELANSNNEEEFLFNFYEVYESVENEKIEKNETIESQSLIIKNINEEKIELEKDLKDKDIINKNTEEENRKIKEENQRIKEENQRIKDDYKKSEEENRVRRFIEEIKKCIKKLKSSRNKKITIKIIIFLIFIYINYFLLKTKYLESFQIVKDNSLVISLNLSLLAAFIYSFFDLSELGDLNSQIKDKTEELEKARKQLNSLGTSAKIV